MLSFKVVDKFISLFLDTTLQYKCPLLCMHMFQLSCINFKTIKDWMRRNKGHTYTPTNTYKIIIFRVVLFRIYSLTFNSFSSWRPKELNPNDTNTWKIVVIRNFGTKSANNKYDLIMMFTKIYFPILQLMNLDFE